MVLGAPARRVEGATVGLSRFTVVYVWQFKNAGFFVEYDASQGDLALGVAKAMQRRAAARG